MRLYTATRKFSVAGLDSPIQPGTVIEFDGMNAKIDGEAQTLPTLRGAIKAKWLVLSDDVVEGAVVVAPKANMQFRAAQQPREGQPSQAAPKRSAYPVITSDERVVHSKSASSVSDNQGTYGTVADGVQVSRTFKTPSKLDKTDMTSSAVSDINQATKNLVIDPGQGRSQEELLAQMTEGDREEYLAKKAAIRERYEAAAHGPVKAPKRAPTPGVTVTSSGGGIGFSETHGVVVGSVASTENPSEPLMSREASSGFVKDGTADTRKRVAKALCSDFPDNYNFDDHWKRRMAHIQFMFAERPDIIRAIFAAESDEFKRALMSEFPNAFS